MAARRVILWVIIFICVIGAAAFVWITDHEARDLQPKVAETRHISLASLVSADIFELQSLETVSNSSDVEAAGHVFTSKVLGATRIDDKQTRSKLVAALQRGIDESDGQVMKCFIP